MYQQIIDKQTSLIVIIFTSLLFIPSLSLSSVTIHGAVSNPNGAALPQVEVTTEGATSTTNEAGEYGFFLQHSGALNFTASKTGYTTQTKSITVNDGETRELNFALELAPLLIDSVTPNWEETGKSFDATIYGKGFSSETRVTISLDSGNKEHILGSIYNDNEEALGVEIAGNRAYVLQRYQAKTLEQYSCYLDIVDISNPATPRRIGRKLLRKTMNPPGEKNCFNVKQLLLLCVGEWQPRYNRY